MSGVSLKTSRNSVSTASLGSPFQSPTVAEWSGHEVGRVTEV